jgi:hypothetical protein
VERIRKNEWGGYAMRRFCAAVWIAAVLAWAAPAFAAGKLELPPVVADVIRNMDFFAIPGAMAGYKHCFIYSVERLRVTESKVEWMGIQLLTPEGFEVRVVYNLATLKIIYSETSVPDKDTRESMRRGSLRVPDAVKLAQAAQRAKLRKGG